MSACWALGVSPPHRLWPARGRVPRPEPPSRCLSARCARQRDNLADRHRRERRPCLDFLSSNQVFSSPGIGEALVAASLEAARHARASWSSWSAVEPSYARVGFKRVLRAASCCRAPSIPSVYLIAIGRQAPSTGSPANSTQRLGRRKMTNYVTGSAGHLGEAFHADLAHIRSASALGLDLRPSPFTDRVGGIDDRSFVGQSLEGRASRR